MSRFVLDTSTVSLAIRSHPTVSARMERAIRNREVLLLSSMVEYELERGMIYARATTLRARLDVLTSRFHYALLDRTAWMQAADLWAYSRKIGEPIPDADLLIAAHALVLGATLVSNNSKHFRHFEALGLRLEDWVT